jgi:hypothetical protein
MPRQPRRSTQSLGGTSVIDRQQFVEEAVKAFPEFESDIRDSTWAGLLHLEVSAFARYTQRQIDGEHHAELKRCFELARRALLEGTPDLKNAIAVSYLEHLDFSDQKRRRSWALGVMPEVLRAEFQAVTGHGAA